MINKRVCATKYKNLDRNYCLICWNLPSENQEEKENVNSFIHFNNEAVSQISVNQKATKSTYFLSQVLEISKTKYF